jgi:hypothetical protein
LSQKLEKEVTHLFNKFYGQSNTVLVGLLNAMQKAAGHLLDLSDTEPYGIRGAKIILKIRNLQGKEEKLGSFSVDSDTVSIEKI